MPATRTRHRHDPMHHATTNPADPLQDSLHDGLSSGAPRERYARAVSASRGGLDERGAVADPEAAWGTMDELGVGGGVEGPRDGYEGLRSGERLADSVASAGSDALHTGEMRLREARQETEHGVGAARRRLADAYRWAMSDLDRIPNLWDDPDQAYDAREAIDRAHAAKEPALAMLEMDEMSGRFSELDHWLEGERYRLAEARQEARYAAEEGAMRSGDARQDAEDAASDAHYEMLLAAARLRSQAADVAARLEERAEHARDELIAKADGIAADGARALAAALEQARSRASGGAKVDARSGGSIADRIARLGRKKEAGRSYDAERTGISDDIVRERGRRFQ